MYHIVGWLDSWDLFHKQKNFQCIIILLDVVSYIGVRTSPYTLELDSGEPFGMSKLLCSLFCVSHELTSPFSL